MSILTCSAYMETTGGPACIAPLDKARGWNGVDGDYWKLLDDPRNASDIYYQHNDIIVFNLHYGNLLLFTDKDAFAVAEIVGGEQLPEHTEDIIGVKLDTDALDYGSKLNQLDCFGGLTTIFDSTLDGKNLADDPGAHSIYPFADQQPPNAAVIDIPRGTWNVRDAVHDLTYYLINFHLRIIIFEHRSKLTAARRTARRRTVKR